MTSHITIRAFEEDDLAAVMALFSQSVREVASQHYLPAQIEAWAPTRPDTTAWRQRLMARPTWVAAVKNRIVGFSDLEPDGHIDMMFVHAEWQGRGVASALLQHILDCAKKQEVKRLYTEASITARPFFERQGFRIVTSQEVELRGQKFQNFKMEKILGTSD